MIAVLTVLLIVFAAGGGVMWYELFKSQRRLESMYNNQSRTNFYLNVAKKTEEQKLESSKEPERTIVDVDEDANVRVVSDNNGLTWSTKQVNISTVEDNREKIVVQINARESLGQNAYHYVDKTFILRKGMDVEEVMGVLGEPDEIQYPSDKMMRLRYPGAGDDEYLDVLIYEGEFYKVEKG